ncbi:arginine N-succinyltransferase [Vibrio sp. V31_P5A7T61]|uniref:arginine N-succinyltransferase n=1 Tax=unclassified Vibrio TaxID=2614977 RepID=UPI0013724EC4|nr:MULTISPECIES: arginine N-succinyltransferase [unclassified Vibrio]NAW61680.1 arginine N-succinyltransferase [Vibrio sp. V31_P5A7T61]NAW78732.1 arginine N-succinyltransferase [Vibrio sp. V33_P6A3T137]NAX02638.1 arginine N-succinyltransferase [Vibrio sp. V34_P3A8T189]NAX07933.1 arginine N-succinyltransferase [Vibrio sp. V40_P2S30T141]NAX64828.1 arginine N-succinyltransferase [Vibrio sp. V32_P6A28T40]
MMLIRPVTRDDKPALLALAKKTGVGFTSLPHHEQRLAQRIERMLATWQGEAPLHDQGYLFVLEETETQQVVGVSGLEVAIGLNEPWYDFRVGTLVHASKELDVYNQMPTLFLSNDHTGCSELCTLFLDPDFRLGKHGHLLSKSRLLFMASFREHFTDKLIAEMRGVSDDSGHSPFWESLGRRFFSIDFSQADHLTGIGQKAFIAELMPKHPLYVDFLSEPAQQVIAKVHPNTEPARKILEDEGMRYEGYIDIFDAGPTLEAYIDDLRMVRDSELCEVLISDSPPQGEATWLIGNLNYHHYRAMISNAQYVDQQISLTAEQADQLQVQQGDKVRIAPLFAQPIVTASC